MDAFREMCDSSASTEDELPIEQGETTRTLAPSPSGSPEAAVTAEAPSETPDEIRMAMELGASLSSGLRGPCSWGVLAERLCDLPGVDTAAVYVVDDAEQRLIPRHVSGAHAQHVKQLSIPVGDRLSGWVAAVEQPMINADAALDLFDADAPALQSALAISCEGPGEARTVVTLYSTSTGAFSALHQRLVEGAAAMLSPGATAAAVEPRPFHRTPPRLCQQRPRINPHRTPSAPVHRKRHVA